MYFHYEILQSPRPFIIGEDQRERPQNMIEFVTRQAVEMGDDGVDFIPQLLPFNPIP